MAPNVCLGQKPVFGESGVMAIEREVVPPQAAPAEEIDAKENGDTDNRQFAGDDAGLHAGGRCATGSEASEDYGQPSDSREDRGAGGE